MTRDATNARHLTWFEGAVKREARESIVNQRGCVVWLTGLSGSGKSTVASALDARLTANGNLSYLMDGDNVRQGLNSDLTFKPSDREENIRRIAEVAALFADAGVITVTAFISPYKDGRNQAREAAPPERFMMVYLDVPLSVCEERDPKGLYKMARDGVITNFTGIDAPYEEPESPDLRVPTHELDVEACVDLIMAELMRRKLLSLASDG